MFSKIKINSIIALYLLTLTFQLSISAQQNEFSEEDLLFQDKIDLGERRVFANTSSINFFINDKFILQIDVVDHKFIFLAGSDKNSFGIVRYYFGKKNEKSYFEIYLLDELFKISFYKKFDFNYEENLPRFLQLSSREVLLLYPSTGKLIYTSNDKNTELNLLNMVGEKVYFQERIGHLFSFNETILICLSQIKENQKSFSKLFSFNKSNFTLEQIDIDLEVISGIFTDSTQIFLTGYNLNPIFTKHFFELKLDESFTNSKLIEIEDELINGRVKGADNLFFSNDCFYKLDRDRLIKLEPCFNDEVILSSLFWKNHFYIITRKELKIKFYMFDENLMLIKQNIIDKYLINPDLKILSNNDLLLIDGNKKILLKNTSEE